MGLEVDGASHRLFDSVWAMFLRRVDPWPPPFCRLLRPGHPSHLDKLSALWESAVIERSAYQDRRPHAGIPHLEVLRQTRSATLA